MTFKELKEQVDAAAAAGVHDLTPVSILSAYGEHTYASAERVRMNYQGTAFVVVPHLDESN